ncbi:MAG: hypothetical protein AB7V61_07975 [Methylocystis sp.]
MVTGADHEAIQIVATGAAIFIHLRPMRQSFPQAVSGTANQWHSPSCSSRGGYRHVARDFLHAPSRMSNHENQTAFCRPLSVNLIAPASQWRNVCLSA